MMKKQTARINEKQYDLIILDGSAILERQAFNKCEIRDNTK